jgi:SAM-dependent methyltransferase
MKAGIETGMRKTVNPERFRRNLLAYTTRAFHLLPVIDKPEILDLGCGTGLATLHLAALCAGAIVAVDWDGRALEILKRRIRKKQLSERIRVVHCRIEDMPFAEESFDIIWGEGALGGIGFVRALGLLRGCLKDGGFLVLHDDAGGSMDKIKALPGAGFALRGYFYLSQEVWRQEYFHPLESALNAATAAAEPYELRVLRRELEEFKKEPQRCASAFFVLEKT